MKVLILTFSALVCSCSFFEQVQELPAQVAPVISQAVDAHEEVEDFLESDSGQDFLKWLDAQQEEAEQPHNFVIIEQVK